MKQKLNLKAEGYYTDSSYKDITSLVAWEYSKRRIVKVEKGLVKPLWFGSTQVYATHSGIRSNPSNLKVIVTMEWLIWFIFTIILLLILSIIMIFFILYFLTRKKKNKMKNLLSKNPREFIMQLYVNVRKILPIFGLIHKGLLPPLAYGRLVEERYVIKNNLFLNFTWKFTEAKYSSHNLVFDDAYAALNGYNDFLEILFSRHTKFSLFTKYCLSLLQLTPLFVK
jgi:uncharacterized protein YneF (UPF0154 family)